MMIKYEMKRDEGKRGFKRQIIYMYGKTLGWLTKKEKLIC